MSENPYAAPQSSLAPQPAREFDQRTHGGDRARRAVAEGTRLCLTAVWCTLGCIGFAVLLGFLGVLAGFGILVLLTIGAICHARGLYELLGVAAETRARGLVALALTTFLIAVVGNILEGAAKAGDLGTMGIEFNLGQAVLSLLTYSSLMLALVRISGYYHEDGARWCAQVALGIVLFCYGLLVVVYVAILTPAGMAWLEAWRGPEARRLGMTLLVAAVGLGIAGFVFYSRSLWLLKRGSSE